MPVMASTTKIAWVFAIACGHGAHVVRRAGRGLGSLDEHSARSGVFGQRRFDLFGGGPAVKVDVPGEAGLGKSVELSCQSAGENEIPPAANWTGIRVISATYGGNCGAPIGNATDAIGPACGGKRACDYTVDVNKLGDPAPACSKSFFVKYQCGGEFAVRTAAVRGEAGLGSSIHLSCAP